LRRLKSKAIKQLGTSGGGNHFVEFGEIEILEDDDQIGLPKGKYVGILSHSGSEVSVQRLHNITREWQ
jgi:tRNA-splicing ligase RtcB